MRSLIKLNTAFFYLALLAVTIPAISAGQALEGYPLTRVELLVSNPSVETAESIAVYSLKRQWVTKPSLIYSDFFFPCFLKNKNLLWGTDFKFYKAVYLAVPDSPYSNHQKLIPAEDPFHLA